MPLGVEMSVMEPSSAGSGYPDADCEPGLEVEGLQEDRAIPVVSGGEPGSAGLGKALQLPAVTVTQGVYASLGHTMIK